MLCFRFILIYGTGSFTFKPSIEHWIYLFHQPICFQIQTVPLLLQFVFAAVTNDHKRRIYFNIFRLFFSIPDLLRKKAFLNPNGSKEPYAFVIYSAYWVKIHYHFRSVDLKIPPKIKEYLEYVFYRATWNNLGYYLLYQTGILVLYWIQLV